MAKRMGAPRWKTRNKFKRTAAEKGRLFIGKFLQTFSQGEKVLLCADPSYQKGMYFRRFHGRVGVVAGKRGRSYEVLVKDGGKTKTLVVSPVHLRRV
jgi:large subunit ribosomal protein L21e